MEIPARRNQGGEIPENKKEHNKTGQGQPRTSCEHQQQTEQMGAGDRPRGDARTLHQPGVNRSIEGAQGDDDVCTRLGNQQPRQGGEGHGQIRPPALPPEQDRQPGGDSSAKVALIEEGAADRQLVEVDQLEHQADDESRGKAAQQQPDDRAGDQGTGDHDLHRRSGIEGDKSAPQTHHDNILPHKPTPGK
ncbi:MAG: hypothetical protein BWY77_02014 [bacterium ADurb.Bin431]|nr:MAG: hypothetical protein BWY77_02014 [bacterium ADurb.Bin431]